VSICFLDPCSRKQLSYIDQELLETLVL
jgi:hypothetical protein